MFRIAVAVYFALSLAVFAATVPLNFSDSVVVDGIPDGTCMEFAPDGRLFVCQQGGKLLVVKNGAVLPAPFLSVSTDTQGERGLLGVAFDPLFVSNGFVYIYYTVPMPQPHNRISRFQADPANPDVALAGSEFVLKNLENLVATNHNGGALHFGTDGKLFVGVGDNVMPAFAQQMTTVKGKILRLNSDGTIPMDNPFFLSVNDQSIWALGLRNPFTFAIHRDTGRMFINDVGQDTYEEINDGKAGANYGWPNTEGVTTDPRFSTPLFYYAHGANDFTGCAITGGAFYDRAAKSFPEEFHNKYFFADFCSGWIRVLDPATAKASEFAKGNVNTVDLDVGPDGALYYYDRGKSLVGRIQYNFGGQAPMVTTPPNLTVAVGASATFKVTATGDGPLSYQWLRDLQPIPGANTDSYTIDKVEATDDGARFACVVTNSFGSAQSGNATLKISSGATNTPPKIKLLAPKRAAYFAGNTIQFSAFALDKQDVDPPDSAFNWSVVFYHDTHTHPFIPLLQGMKSGSFVIPATGETAANVKYRVSLIVTDSGGLTATTFVDLKPKVVKLSVTSVPPGAALTLDGQPVTALNLKTVAGMTRTIGVVSPQTIGGINYIFDSWSDGGEATHDIAPKASAKLTVTLKPAE